MPCSLLEDFVNCSQPSHQITLLNLALHLGKSYSLAKTQMNVRLIPCRSLPPPTHSILSSFWFFSLSIYYVYHIAQPWPTECFGIFPICCVSMKFFSQLGCKPLEAWDLSYASLASFTGQPHTLFKMFRQENKQAHQPHRDHLVELQIKNLTPREKQPSPRPPSSPTARVPCSMPPGASWTSPIGAYHRSSSLPQ